ncbi:MAG: methylenetetrahydrofolate dehydrogenase [Gammaproteobacteria bacterium]|nr:methylenetetrahydrofolate dehydrogenase [Gammaproteobacteria bacterium]
MKKLLFQLDTDPIANTFDTVVAYDGGADHVIPIGGMTPRNVATMVAGTIFTRSPKDKKNTALFVSGSDMVAGEALLAAIRKNFFADFRVSVMLDSNGSNTTAAAAVAKISRHVSPRGKRAVVLAGTGPVGQRAAVMLAREGASVALSSRKLERAQQAAAAVKASFGVEVDAVQAGDAESTRAALAGANIVLATGAAGIELLAEDDWRVHPDLEILVDANATPPLGIGGVDTMDRGKERHGRIVYGAIGFGALKLELHRACVASLFERNDLVLDADEIYTRAKQMV